MLGWYLVRPQNQKDAKSWSVQRGVPLSGMFLHILSLVRRLNSYQIIKLYDRSLPEGPDDDQVPADLIHHFLLAICTQPGIGVCFRDRGWYPRETDDDERTTETDAGDAYPRSGRVYNKILGNLLRTLRANDDARQQELTHRILSACPELVARYVFY